MEDYRVKVEKPELGIAHTENVFTLVIKSKGTDGIDIGIYKIEYIAFFGDNIRFRIVGSDDSHIEIRKIYQLLVDGMLLISDGVTV